MDNIGHDGNISFRKLTPDALQEVAVVAQALDNQWVSRATLSTMLKRSRQRGLLKRILGNKRVLGLADMREARERIGRMEYIRSLINAEQLVINRAYFFNNDVVNRDYLTNGDQREALKELLANAVIVPYYFRESSPVEPPLLFKVRPGVLEAWRHLCEETETSGLRLSWDDAKNKQETSTLAVRFKLWLLSLTTYADADRAHALTAIMRDLDMPESWREPFKARLREVSAWAMEMGSAVSRETFYQKFITTPASDTTAGHYDPSKPFAGELKQLADLSYNVNLPDALRRYPLTPMDSLPRTSLQELTVHFQERHIADENLVDLVRQAAFSLAQGGLYLESMGELSLRDVIAVRASPAWHEYARSLRTLLDNPLADPMSFPLRAQDVYDRYTRLAHEMTEYVKRVRHDATNIRLEKWEPALRLVVQIGVRAVVATWHPAGSMAGSQLTYQILGSDPVTSKIADGEMATLRLIIGGFTDRSANAALETSIDFAHGKLQRAQDAWNDIIGALRDVNAHDEANFAGSSDEFDPNINYSEVVEGLAS